MAKPAPLSYTPALIYPGLPVNQGWTQPLLHRCYRCGREVKQATKPGYVCDCVDCRSAEGLQMSMQLVVPAWVWMPLSLN